MSDKKADKTKTLEELRDGLTKQIDSLIEDKTVVLIKRDDRGKMSIKQIRDSLGKESVTAWDVGNMTRAIGDLLQMIPGAIIMNVDGSMSDIKFMANSISKFGTDLLSMHEQIESACDDAWSKAEAAGNQFFARKRELEERMRDASFNPGFRVPHGLNELADLADRFSHLDDQQWGRVIELAKALAPKAVE